MTKNILLISACTLLFGVCFLWFARFANPNEARRNVSTYNRATLRTIALAITEFSNSEGGRIPASMDELRAWFKTDRLTFRHANGSHYEWIYIAKTEASNKTMPLIIAPFPDNEDNHQTRLTLTRGLEVKVIEERSIDTNLRSFLDAQKPSPRNKPQPK